MRVSVARGAKHDGDERDRREQSAVEALAFQLRPDQHLQKQGILFDHRAVEFPIPASIGSVICNCCSNGAAERANGNGIISK